MISILQVFYSVFSGLLLSLAIPNEYYLHGVPFLAFIAIIPLYKAIKSAGSYRRAFLLGFIQTLTTHLASSFWLAFFKDFAIFTLGGSALASGLYGGVTALAMYMPYYNQNKERLYQYSIYRNLVETEAFRITYFSALYVIYEWIKSSGFLGYPWGTISGAMFDFPQLRQLAEITGTYGITFIVVFFNCIASELIEYIFNRTKHYAENINKSLLYAGKTFLLLFLFIFIFGQYEYSKTRTPVKSINSVLVQANADPWDTLTDKNIILNSERLTKEGIEKLKSENKEPQLIVWSEGVLFRPFPLSSGYYRNNPSDGPLIPFIEEIQTPLIAGGSYIEQKQNSDGTDYDKYYNSAIVFDKNGAYAGFYAKLHLVPFAELIPGADTEFVQKFLSKVAGISSGWSKGEYLTFFDLPCNSLIDKTSTYIRNYTLVDNNSPQDDSKTTVKIATPICFDDAFTDVMRPLFLNGAELFVNLTDDSWSLKKSSENQHCINASYRAIEYRTTLVRATNAGYTVVIDPSGKIIADLPLFVQDSLACEVPVYQRRITVYAYLGNWFVYLCLLLFFVTSLICKQNFISKKLSILTE